MVGATYLERRKQQPMRNFSSMLKWLLKGSNCTIELYQQTRNVECMYEKAKKWMFFDVKM